MIIIKDVHTKETLFESEQILDAGRWMNEHMYLLVNAEAPDVIFYVDSYYCDTEIIVHK